jgi:formylglycine-generating enzyme required for sulfatase activity
VLNLTPTYAHALGTKQIYHRARWSLTRPERSSRISQYSGQALTRPVVARGGHSASSPEGLMSTSREAVDAGRAATGHAYIGFRCVTDAQLVL